MRKFVVDIETDDIKATVIHCIVAKDIDKGDVLSWHGDTLKDFAKWCESVDIFIMHNGTMMHIVELPSVYRGPGGLVID